MNICDIFRPLSKLHELEELHIEQLIDIKPRFMANRASARRPFRLASVKRLVLHDTIPRRTNPRRINGLAWCEAINDIFPNLQELSLRTPIRYRLNAIQTHVHLLHLQKCCLDLF